MRCIIADPVAYDKHTAYDEALRLIRLWCDENTVASPAYVIDDATGNYGFYDLRRCSVHVNIRKSSRPVKTPGFAWSFTGYKADHTVPGIVMHETGHHVNAMGVGNMIALKISKCMRSIATEEAAVSGYEPNVHEVFAEAFRLFILNPTLLREGRPLRWKFMTETLGLRPLHDEPWRVILTNAHPRMIKAAEGWLARKLRKS